MILAERSSSDPLAQLEERTIHIRLKTVVRITV